MRSAAVWQSRLNFHIQDRHFSQRVTGGNDGSQGITQFMDNGPGELTAFANFGLQLNLRCFNPGSIPDHHQFAG
jgi:hypothetical protein